MNIESWLNSASHGGHPPEAPSLRFRSRVRDDSPPLEHGFLTRPEPTPAPEHSQDQPAPYSKRPRKKPRPDLYEPAKPGRAEKTAARKSRARQAEKEKEARQNELVERFFELPRRREPGREEGGARRVGIYNRSLAGLPESRFRAAPDLSFTNVSFLDKPAAKSFKDERLPVEPHPRASLGIRAGRASGGAEAVEDLVCFIGEHPPAPTTVFSWSASEPEIKELAVDIGADLTARVGDERADVVPGAGEGTGRVAESRLPNCEFTIIPARPAPVETASTKPQQDRNILGEIAVCRDPRGPIPGEPVSSAQDAAIDQLLMECKSSPQLWPKRGRTHD